MKISEVYQKYQIMPQLADHQFSVAAVASLICQYFEGNIDRENIIAACLLHDMGNIVKFNFDKQTLAKMPGLIDVGDAEHWQAVKEEFLQKYGSGSHNVTMKILNEVPVNQRIKELVDCVGFSQASDNASTFDFGKKICAYSDMRVLPLGVGSLEERLADLRVRYVRHQEGTKERDQFESSLQKIEQQIFEQCKIKPTDITKAVVEQIKPQLKNYEI